MHLLDGGQWAYSFAYSFPRRAKKFCKINCSAEMHWIYHNAYTHAHIRVKETRTDAIFAARKNGSINFILHIYIYINRVILASATQCALSLLVMQIGIESKRESCATHFEWLQFGCIFRVRSFHLLSANGVDFFFQMSPEFACRISLSLI